MPVHQRFLIDEVRIGMAPQRTTANRTHVCFNTQSKEMVIGWCALMRRSRHALRVPYPRAERAARAAVGRGTPGSPRRTCRNQLVVRRLNLARFGRPITAQIAPEGPQIDGHDGDRPWPVG